MASTQEKEVKNENMTDSESDEDEISEQSDEDQTPTFPPVDILCLREHIAKLNKQIEGEHFNGFDEEFECIEYESSKYWTPEDFSVANADYNRLKNRYGNVLPTERTRVLLNDNGAVGSDYINANFVKNHYNELVYIAAQGPLKATVYDFWRMVWLQNADIIVMLTKLKENSKLKCYKYWPSEGDPDTYGEFIISILSIENNNDCIILRKMKIQNTQTKEEREINHIQYAEWPDHGLPCSTAKFRETLHLVDRLHKKGSPIILHCSAGIGRSGTFCAVHSILDDISRGATTLNLPEVVLRMRRDRHGMVQTRDQYEFCYLAILEELESRNYFSSIQDNGILS